MRQDKHGQDKHRTRQTKDRTNIEQDKQRTEQTWDKTNMGKDKRRTYEKIWDRLMYRTKENIGQIYSTNYLYNKTRHS